MAKVTGCFKDALQEYDEGAGARLRRAWQADIYKNGLMVPCSQVLRVRARRHFLHLPLREDCRMLVQATA